MWSMGQISGAPSGGVAMFLAVNILISQLSKNRVVSPITIEWIRSVLGPIIATVVFFLTAEISKGWWVGFLIMCLGGNIFHTIVTMSAISGRIMVSIYAVCLFTCYLFHQPVDWGMIVSEVGAVIIGGLVFTEMLAELADSLFKQVLQRDEIEKQKTRVEEQRLLIEKKNIDLEQVYQNITDSIRYAKRIQIALTPMESALKNDIEEFFLLNKPKDIVSGDFFWTGKKNGYLFLVVADCTGHGVPGAILTVIGNNLLNTVIHEKGEIDPVRIMYSIDEKLANIFQNHDGDENDLADGMDMSLVRIDSAKKELLFVGAKRSAFILQEGVLKELTGNRYSLGRELQLEKFFAEESLVYEKDCVLYLFTDGYTDQFGGPDNKRFLKYRFRELIDEIKFKNMHEQHSLLDRAIRNWRGNLTQTDDILVAGIRL